MPIESARPSEFQHNTETEHPDAYAGLHARLLIAELKTLDPEREVSPDDLKRIGSFEDRNYVPYEKTSKKGRKKFWREMVEKGEVENTKKAKYAKWQQTLLDGINQQLSAKQKQEIFYPLFEQIGINKGNAQEAFTADDAQKLYEHYFVNPKNPNNPNNPHPEAFEHTGVKQFVRDVMTTFTKPDGKPDERKIKEHLPMLEKFAVNFGEEEAAMVSHLIMEEVKEANKPKTTKRTPIKKINNLKAEEKRILTLIKEANHPPDLPVLRSTDEIQHAAVTDGIILALADTGAGKTVGIPPLVRETLKPGEKILVTQPQQNTAISTPHHIAGEFSLRPGKEIGWITGGGVKYDKRKTDIVFLTERIGLYQLLNKDGWFENVRHMMFDEAHKLSPDMEIMAALAREEQQRREQEGAKIPLTAWFISATADEEKFKKYAKIDHPIRIEGRTFGKDVQFLDKSLYNENDSPDQKAAKLYNTAAEKAAEIHRDATSERGDIIISAAGNTEMDNIEKLLNEKNLEDIQIVRIHSGSSKKEKDELKKEAPKGIRRIIICTNAMETGVTVKGAKYVINTGEKKDDFYNPITGMTEVPKVLQSQAEARQWEGRVGRTSYGYVFHLMTEEEFNSRSEQPPSPIHKTDITQYVLLLKAAGRDIRDLELPSGKLEDDRVKSAEEALQKLGALDTQGEATEIGKRMAEIPTDYHITRAIAQAEKEKKGMKQMYTLAAILDVAGGQSLIQDVGKLGPLRERSSDFITYLRIYEEFLAHGSKREWAQKHGVKFNILKNVAYKLKDLQKRAKNLEEDTTASPDELGYYIFLGYQDRLMKQNQKKTNYTWEREQVEDVDIMIGRDSIVSGKDEYVVSMSNTPIKEYDIWEDRIDTGFTRRRIINKTVRVKAGTGKKTYLSTVQAVKPEWLK